VTVGAAAVLYFAHSHQRWLGQERRNNGLPFVRVDFHVHLVLIACHLMVVIFYIVVDANLSLHIDYFGKPSYLPACFDSISILGYRSLVFGTKYKEERTRKKIKSKFSGAGFDKTAIAVEGFDFINFR